MKLAYFFLAIAGIASGAVQAGSPTPEILVTALRGMQWQVRYDFAQPVDKLEFKSSPTIRVADMAARSRLRNRHH